MTVIVLVDETDEEVVALALERLGLSGLHPAGRIIGFRDKDGVRGAFYFERYTGIGGSIVAHWFGRDKHWLMGHMLTTAFVYAYDQLKCRTIFGEVRAKALAIQAIDEKLGFRQVARIEGVYPDDDLILYALRKEDCMWLPDELKEEAA